MKRKLALLLAGTMVLSTVSTSTIFAAAASASVDEALELNPAKGADLMANVTIYTGDTAVVLPTNVNFKVTLENAKFDNDSTGVGEDSTTAVSSTATSAGAYMLDGSDVAQVYTATGSVAELQLNGNASRATIPVAYSVTDKSKPVYATIQSDSVALFQSGVKVQLTSVTNTTGGVTLTAEEATQLSPYTTLKDGSVTIAGNSSDSIKTGKYTVKLPSGYRFDGTPGVDLRNEDEANDTITNVVVEDRTLTFEIVAADRTTVVDPFNGAPRIYIDITGIGVVNNTGTYNKDVNVTVSGNGVSGSATVAKFATYALEGSLVDEDDVPVIEAGDKSKASLKYTALGGNTDAASWTDYVKGFTTEEENLTAEITIEENVPNAFRGGDFKIVLTEGVTVTGINVIEENNTHNDGAGAPNNLLKYTVNASKPSDFKDYGTSATTGLQATTQEYANVTFDGNEVTFKNFYADQLTDTWDFTIQLEVQTAPNFSGDVVATLAPGANTIGDFDEQEIGVIAKVEASADVATTVQEVPIGFTNYSTADIVVTELGKNEFEDGELLVFSLVAPDGSNSDSYGFTDANVEVKGGEATINVKSNAIYVKIEDAGNDEAIEITLTDVEVYSDQATARTNADPVKVKVATNADSGNTMQVSMSKGYIKFVEELTANPSAIYNQNVTIELGATQATLADGTKVDLYGASYISADGNTMMPVKGTGLALGLAQDKIIYDAQAKIATFFLPDGSIAQIQAGNNYATVNGVKLPLLDAKGNLVAPVIKDGRFYLPLRAAAQTVFNVETDYNAADKSVVLNPTK